MRILFRVDASREIGSGHASRCLALASAMRKKGAQCVIAARHLPSAHAESAAALGCDVVRLVSNGAPDERAHPWLQVSQTQDAREMLTRFAGMRFDWLIVDHYALDATWEQPMYAIAERILVIDDLADRKHACDVLLDQNLRVDPEADYSALVPRECRLLLGPRFALLRDEFSRARAAAKVRDGSVGRLLVFFGGFDSAGDTLKALNAVERLADSDTLQVDVVIGAEHPHRSQIEARCAEAGHHLHVQTHEMAKLMLSADLALGAGGSATWERCCLGLPCVTFVTAENQRAVSRVAAATGLIYAPTTDLKDEEAICNHLESLRANPLLLASISSRGMAAVDGFGTARVTREMGLSAVAIRRARESDAKDVFEWRNQAHVRKWSRAKDLVDWSQHLKWFATVLNDSQRFLLIGESGGRGVGVVRFDTSGGEAEISIYLAPDRHGTGAELLCAAESWLARELPRIETIKAEVLGNNVSSNNLFLRAHYERASTHYVKRLNQ